VAKQICLPDLRTCGTSVALFDSNGDELPTTGPASEFLDVSLAGGANPQVATFGSRRERFFRSRLARRTCLTQGSGAQRIARNAI
jgi:hypothetical protein